jgi:hypothetical protein
LPAAAVLLHAALRAAPRRYRLPPLPPDVAAARDAGVETALAFTIEAARLGLERGTPPAAAVRDLFTASLAGFVRAAMAPHGGDASFQALVLQAHDPEVHEFVQLSASASGDRRTLRSMADTIAHPGKTRTLAAGPARTALERLHALVDAGRWVALRDAVQAGALLPVASDAALAEVKGIDPQQPGAAAAGAPRSAAAAAGRAALSRAVRPARAGGRQPCRRGPGARCGPCR